MVRHVHITRVLSLRMEQIMTRLQYICKGRYTITHSKIMTQNSLIFYFPSRRPITLYTTLVAALPRNYITKFTHTILYLLNSTYCRKLSNL